MHLNAQCQLTTARKSDGIINYFIRLVNEEFKGRSYCRNTMSELKAVLEMTTACPDKLKDGNATDTHSCSNDGMIQLGPLGSDSDVMFEVVEISDVCLYTFSCSMLHPL